MVFSLSHFFSLNSEHFVLTLHVREQVLRLYETTDTEKLQFRML